MSISQQQLTLTALVVDIDESLHWGFGVMLERQTWVEQCVVVSSIDAAADAAERLRPDVALATCAADPIPGSNVCEAIRQASPSTRVLFVAGPEAISKDAVKAVGASGVVSNDWSAPDLVRAVRMVSLGVDVFRSDDSTSASSLSPREHEVLRLISSGATNREIAGQLYLSPHTVKEHASAIYRKLGVRNRIEAVQRAQRLSWIA